MLRSLLQPAVLAVISCALLAGCASSDSASKHLSERGRNVEACRSLDELYVKLAADADAGTMGDPAAYEKTFVASWKTIGRRADSPMGDWMIKNIEAAEKAKQNGDTTAEEKGSASNNGASVTADEGSIQTRCTNLGVTLH